MNTSLFIASSGVRAYQGKLDTIANNISNVETTGFKRREASFSENLTVSIQNQAQQQKEIGRLSPLGIRTTFGSRIGAASLEDSQGAEKKTDHPYDLMVEGKGFFQVRRTTGTTTEILYTRNGAFQQTPVSNDRFQLVNAQGDVLLDQNGNPIEGSTGMDFHVAENGTIVGTNQQIVLVDFTNPQLMMGEGGVYRLTGGTVTLLNQNPNAKYKVKQGFLESSNVDLNQEMTDMIKTQRGYQANARALSYADQMMGIANGILRS